jgi:hypothetical protein
MRPFLLVLLLCFTINTAAQGYIGLDELLEVPISAEAPSLRWHRARPGVPIHISAKAVDAGENTPDLVLWLVLDGRVVAYNDNYGESSNPSIILSSPEDAVYSVYIDSFNGVSTGTAEVLVTLLDPFNLQINEEINDFTRLSLYLPESQVFRHQFVASGSVRVSAKDLSGNLDLYIRLLSEGQVVAINDDHKSEDTTLGRYDSFLDLFLGAGFYVVEVRDFLGNAGQIEILLSFE